MVGISPLYNSLDYLAGMALQPDAYLIKPFLPDELVARVNLVLSAVDSPQAEDGAGG
jgi:DNA-binding response OmpR family regulator